MAEHDRILDRRLAIHELRGGQRETLQSSRGFHLHHVTSPSVRLPRLTLLFASAIRWALPNRGPRWRKRCAGIDAHLRVRRLGSHENVLALLHGLWSVHLRSVALQTTLLWQLGSLA